MSTTEIRRALGGEPWCFPPDVIGKMNRAEAFEVYLKPEEKKESGDSGPSRSHRERQFDHWLVGGYAKTWEDCERLWQQHGLDKQCQSP